MRLAWFRPLQPDPADPLDDTGSLVTALRSTHAVDIVTAANAHDFVWMYFRRPYDVCVFELDNTAAHAFIWPYVLHYPGITALRSLRLGDSRTDALTRQHRHDDVRAEFTFSGDARLLRAPLLASRMTVVASRAAAEALQTDYPDAHIRCAPIGVRDIEASHSTAPRTGVVVGVMPGSDLDVVTRACERAGNAGARVTLTRIEKRDPWVRDTDIIIATRWPPNGEPDIPALVGMAAGKPVVVMETETTADWPAYDPQTWRPRGDRARAPVVVSIDTRDDEHSLMIAVRDLARDAELRDAIGAAARDWWRAHATVAEAAAAWLALLEEAAARQPPPRPADWPPHLAADGTEAARAILADIGATVDFLR